MRLRQIVFLAVLSLLVIAPIDGQSPNGTISGIVVDSSGAVIVGAEILIANDATGLQYPGKTNGDGLYLVPNLPPGTYRLQVSKVGFKTVIKPDIVIHVQDALAINFTLPIGALSEIVTVTGGAPLVNTEGAAVSTVIDRKFVENLPLNGRSFNTLLQLTPGVVIAPSNTASPGQFSVAGQRNDANNFTVDGVSANFGVPTSASIFEAGTGGTQAFSALGGTSSLVSVEALQEFRVETSSVAPEFGRSPGGQVILNTRSGTNGFHGGVYEYFRNDALDANDWFANQAGKARAPERHNDFGGFLGGRIQRDRTFFFISYEGARLRLPKASTIRVPSAFARQQAPTTLAPFLKAYPQPDDTVAAPGVYASAFTGVWSNRASLDAGSIRIDHKFNDRVSVFGRFSDAPSSISVRSQGLSFLEQIPVDTRTLTVGTNIVVNSRMANTLRGNFSTQNSRDGSTFDSFGGAVALDPRLLLGSLSSANVTVQFTIRGTQTLRFGPSVRNRARQLNFVDELSMSSATHQLKFGGDYRAIFLDVNSPQYSPSFRTAQTVQGFLSSGLANLNTGASPGGHLLVQSLSLFGQDAWKVTARLTMVYGLRWELNPAPSARRNTKLASWMNVDNPANLALAPFGTPLWNTRFANFAPRLGIAYHPTDKGDLVLRAGAGIFYDLGVGSSAGAINSFPNRASLSATGVPVPVSDLTPYLPVISLQAPYQGSITAFSPNLKLPRSYQWNVAIEKSFRGNQVISGTYVGQAGRDLLRQEALFQPNSNFTGDVLLTLNDARSNYNALQVQYKRRLSSGLQALLNYTWSHSLDNASNDAIPNLSNTVISGASDYASSDFDVRHSFSGAITYASPSVSSYRALSLLTKGWSVDTVVVVRSGFPFNAQVLGTSPDQGGSVVTRPDRVAGQPLWIPNLQAPGGKIININAFSIPSTARQGTEGRNDIPGFGLAQVDLSVGRKFSITERTELQFRADAFNAFNHPNFVNPTPLPEFGSFFFQSQSMLNQGLGGLNPLFQEGGPRSIQLSLKLTF